MYSAERDRHTTRRLSLLGELHHAIENFELVFYYQPVADIVDRADHVDRGARPLGAPRSRADPARTSSSRSPSRPVSSSRSPRTRWTHALRQCRAWLDAGREIGVAVNVSVRNLYEDGFAAKVARHLTLAARPGRAAHARDHRRHRDGRPGARGDRARRAARDGRPDRDRRLRDGLLVARAPQAPAGRLHQDRPVVRHEHGARRRRGDRPVDDRPRPQPRARRSWPRGSRPSAHLAAARRARLRLRPGLLHRPSRAGGPARSRAHARGRSGARWRRRCHRTRSGGGRRGSRRPR